MTLSFFNQIAALVPLMLSPLLVHLYIPLWKSTTALSAMPHLVSGMNFPKNFANLSPTAQQDGVESRRQWTTCRWWDESLSLSSYLSSVHHHHHHHHHFYYASLHLCSAPDSKLTFSINPPTIVSLTFPYGYHGFLWPFPDCVAPRFFFCFALFIFFCLIDLTLSWFYQLLNCTLNLCSLCTLISFLSFPFNNI